MTSDHLWGCSWGHAWLIWLEFSDNVGMIPIFIWYLFKKWDQTVHHKKLIQSVWKLIGYPVRNLFWLSKFHDFWCHCAIKVLKISKNIATFILYEACVNWETHKRHKVNLVTKRQTGAEIALLKPKISPMRKREFFLKTLKLNDYLANVVQTWWQGTFWLT